MNEIKKINSQSKTFSGLNFVKSESFEKKRFGVEIELLVLDENFKETNEADKLLEIAYEYGLNVEKECSKFIVEIISEPGSVDDVLLNMTESFKKLLFLAKSMGLIVIPLDFPLDINFNAQIRNDKKYIVQSEILGNDFKYSGVVCGTHIHIDVDSKFSRNQINIFKLLDPLVISLCGTTEAIYEGSFVNNYRLFKYRKIMYKNFEQNGGLTPLVHSHDDFKNQMFQLTESFKKNYKGADDISRYILPNKGVWGAMRFKAEINTLEIRSPGAIPDFLFLHNLLKLFEQIDIVANSEKFDLNFFLIELFGLSDRSVVFEKLKRISDMAILEGLNSKEVNDYCNSLISVLGVDKIFYLYNNLIERTIIRKKIVSLNINNFDKYKLLLDFCLKSIEELDSKKDECEVILR